MPLFIDSISPMNLKINDNCHKTRDLNSFICKIINIYWQFSFQFLFHQNEKYG